MKKKLQLLFSLVCLLFVSLSARAQVDVTSQYLSNADLSTDPNVSGNGWTLLNNWRQDYQTAKDDQAVNVVEFWGWNPYDFEISQSVTLPAGDYRIAVNAFFRNGGNGDGTNDDCAWIFAGEKKQKVVGLTNGGLNAYENGHLNNGGADIQRAANAFATGAFSNAFDFSLDAETTLSIGFKGTTKEIASWVIFGPVKLYKYSLEDYLIDYRKKVAEAEAVEGKMGAAEKQALNDAIVPESSFSIGSQVSQAIATLNEAIAAAKLSIDRYAALAAEIASGEAIKTNVSDADAVAEYDAAVADVIAAYEAGTVSDFAAAAKTISDAAAAIVKKQDVDGSDYTLAIVNPQCNGANSAVEGWTANFPVGGNGPMKPSADAIEYWAGNASAREEAQFDIWQEITGLPNGIYTVTADMYNSLNGEEGAAWDTTCGLYCASGENEAYVLVDTEGDQLNSYTTGEIEVTNGKIRIGVKSYAPLAARWFVADNFKLTLVKALGGEPVIEKTPYELAMESIEDGGTYRISADHNGSTYYLTPDGHLTDNVDKAATFTLTKVAGEEYEYGFLVDGGISRRFSNPPGTNASNLKCGYINTSTGVRTNWDAQVFFLNKDGKYAVRSTNAYYATSSWGWVGSSYWTIEDVEGAAVAQYQWDPNYIWQLEPYDDPRPAAFAKTESWPFKLQQAVGLVQDASMYTSNAPYNINGRADGQGYPGLLDGEYTTYFHSDYNDNTAPDEDHYLQAELEEPVKEFFFYFKKRSQNNNNRPTILAISASNDGENFTDVTTITEGLPSGATPLDYTSAKVTLGSAYKYIRFTVQKTNNDALGNGHPFFTFSEFYLLPADDVVEAAVEYIPAETYMDISESDAATIDALDEEIGALAGKVELFAYVDKLQPYVDAKDTYIDNDGVADFVSSAISRIKSLSYGSAQEVADQKVEALSLALQFFAGITPIEDIDVTDIFLANPTPTSNSDGWEGDKSNAFDPANNNAEFWNMPGASFYQTVTLPAGDYKASVVAVTRDEMIAKFIVNDAETNIVTMPNRGTEAGVDYLDRREHCNTWFNAGNGVNTVEFSLDEESAVTVSLTADSNSDGDHWLVWRNFSIILLAQEPVAPEVVLNAPTWNAKEGTQEEPYMLDSGTPLKITYTADNLEENGISKDEVQVKVTVMVAGDVSTTPEMGSETAHSVMGETFYIPLGEAEFPVALKEGYYYQNIAVMAAQLVKPGTEETPEEVIATYAGAPAMLHWVGVPAPVDSDVAYENALAAIEDGGQYRIFTEIDGQKYYVTEGGLLTSSTKDRGLFTLKKVAGKESQYKAFGFKIDSGSKRFTNPPLANNVADMTRGVFATTDGNRDDWEAQVFFLNGDKYAIRSCNVPDGTSSWNDAGRTYWTWVVEDVPTPRYSYDMVYCWQLEGPLKTINVTYALQEADGTKVSEVVKQQESNSEVNVPANLTSIFAYEYAVSGTIGDEDCTITVTRTFKEGVVHSLDELSNEKAYTIRCDRGALLTKDGYVASTAHSSLTNAEAAEFAIINYEGKYYLYSVADGQFMTFDPTVSDDGSRGPLADTPVHGTEDAVILEAKTDPYFFAYFTANGNNYGFNTNGNNPYGYVINSWMNADPGNQYYIIESSDFDPTDALAALDAYFHPELTELNITLDIKRETGLGYGVTFGEVDFAAAKDFLGVEELTTDMLWIVNPDGEEIDNFADYDGWFNIQGAAETWFSLNKTLEGQEGDPEPGVCVKFFQAIPDGKFEICDMNGADQEGKTYTVKWALKANGLAVVYTINVTFAAPEVVEVTEISDKVIQASIEYDYAEPNYIEKTVVLTDEQVATICEELGIASLDEATPYAYNPTTKEVVYVYKAFDGWRDANGDFAMWTGTAAVPACVKYTDGKTYYCYNLQGMKDQEIKCYWAISKGAKAVLVEINFIYSGAPQGTDYAGIINQTQSHPQAGVLGETTSEQTVTVTQNEDGTVNITFSGFDLPMAALGSFGEFTIENVAVTTNDDGSISYAAEGFQVTTGGQMPAPYNGTLEGTQASADATPVFHLTLQNATTDDVWFGADQAAIDAVGIRGINADEINGTIYDLGGRKVTKIQRGGIYIINGKKVAVK